MFTYNERPTGQVKRNIGGPRSSGRGSSIFAGTTCATRGRVGSGRMTCPSGCFRSRGDGNPRWRCAATRACRWSIAALCRSVGLYAHSHDW